MPVRRIAIVAAAASLLVASACGNDAGDSGGPGGTAPLAPARSTTTASIPTTVPIPAGRLASVRIRLAKVATLRAPTALVPRHGTDDLYATERIGVVRRLQRSGNRFALSRTAVLDIRRNVVDLSSERGLLGIAFSPDGGRLFVSYTDGNDHGNSVIASYAMNGEVADPASRIEILRLAQPFANHNGGCILFGPDGYLYAGYGDGGSQGDPSDNGQNRNVLLAKMLRLDVSSSTTGTPYLVPADNPFAHDANARHEIWSTGVRNPWRFSFDRANGDLWIGDVGGSDWEEIDYLPASTGTGRGVNLGWSLREGAHDTDKPGRRAGLTDPIYEYSHQVGISVIGGYVYRGSAIPDLAGAYVFSDLAAGKLWALTQQHGKVDQRATLPTPAGSVSQVVGFGEDNEGELYVVDIAGPILAIRPA